MKKNEKFNLMEALISFGNIRFESDPSKRIKGIIGAIDDLLKTLNEQPITELATNENLNNLRIFLGEFIKQNAPLYCSPLISINTQENF